MDEKGSGLVRKLAKTPKQRTVVAYRRPAQDTPRFRIVIADDNSACLDHICNLIQIRFEVVARAADGIECVEAVRRLSPSVVVTDVSMPRMNGIEATRLIKKHCPGVKVIVLSVHDDPAFIEAAFEAGASGYVLKLQAFQDLVPAIEKALDRRALHAVSK
jgi:DNA-binding NarL/FixJ family response regulator